jgi:hypothetical protein
VGRGAGLGVLENIKLFIAVGNRIRVVKHLAKSHFDDAIPTLKTSKLVIINRVIQK